MLIYDFNKNSQEKIRIEISELKGRDLINIRIWYQAQDYNTGEIIYKPTQKGVTLNVSQFEELKTGIEKLGNYIEDQQKGIVPDQPAEPSGEVFTEEINSSKL